VPTAEGPNGGETQAQIYRPLASLVGISDFVSQFSPRPSGREEVRIHAALGPQLEFTTHTQSEAMSRVATDSWRVGLPEHDAHDGGDLAGLHDGDILILSFLRIAISDQLFHFMLKSLGIFSLFIF